ncbi:MAG: DUF2177 family protein [Silicimonas sp.]|nr:DUF2177 family protein [Silicimonas sp.]RZW00641.1 MAG: DUF2177 family protein [Paracoccaceae bacterium]
MQTLTLYATTAAIFLILDAIMLNTVIAPLFRQYLGDAILDSPRIGPAAAFYLFYVAGLLILVSYPALKDGDVFRALWQGALLGAVAYGTYEWTNYATLRAWTPSMVFTDWAWGTVLTGVSAAGGVWATRAIFS